MTVGSIGRVILYALAAALAVASVVFVLVRLRAVFTAFLMAGILAYILHPMVCYLERRSVPRGVGILILYVGVGVVLWSVGKLLLPGLMREISDLAAALPEQTERLEGLTRRTVEDVRTVQLPATFEEAWQTLIHRVEELLERFAARVADVLFTVMGALASLALAPVLAFYLLRDWALIKKSVLCSLPVHWRRHVVELGERINRLMSGYLRGQLLVSAIVGGLTSCGLALFGVPYAIVIGMLAGLFELIPYFGPVIGTLPGVTLAMMDSPRKALYVLLMFVGIQQLESAVLSPRIVGTLVGLHPLTVIGVVLAGAETFGIVGMLLAVPVTATVKVVWTYVREVLTRRAMAEGHVP